jgi:chromosome segregation ATPase
MSHRDCNTCPDGDAMEREKAALQRRIDDLVSDRREARAEIAKLTAALREVRAKADLVASGRAYATHAEAREIVDICNAAGIGEEGGSDV